jgi:hypothetical protein
MAFTTGRGTPIEPRNFNRSFDGWPRVKLYAQGIHLVGSADPVSSDRRTWRCFIGPLKRRMLP